MDLIGSGPRQGIVKINNPVNATICDSFWDDRSAMVVCRMLGTPYAFVNLFMGI